MSVASIDTAHITGLESDPVRVEVDVSRGLYSFSIVGLADKAIDESKDRVIAALKNTRLLTPKTENHKVTVSLTPAHIKKEGSHFDVPIALSYLAATKQINLPKNSGWFVGELSLTGEILPLYGILSIAQAAKKKGVSSLYVPYANKEEAALVTGINVYACKHLEELVIHFGGKVEENISLVELSPQPKTLFTNTLPEHHLDFKDVKGQDMAKRALEIAAAGGHNIALYGPPGTGKTMLARAFTGILPPLTEEEALQVTQIHSLSKQKISLITHPPFRSPHHTSSYVSLVGGGASPKPGEITLAHNGVLFLDEFPEFEKKAIESLRQPLEEGYVTVSRAKGTFQFPAACTLVAAMNPCPCGYMGSKQKRCVCTPADIHKYARKLSGPIMDRIDMWVPVNHINYDLLISPHEVEGSEAVRKRVLKAREFAKQRFTSLGFLHSKNKDISSKNIQKTILLEDEANELLKQLSTKNAISPRAYHRIIRLSRTIADCRNSEKVRKEDVLEAFQYRPKLYDDKL